MEFGWINLFCAGIVVLIMIPNIIYAVRQKQDEAQAIIPKYLSACEQVGRYGCIVLMWLPLLVWKFGFGNGAYHDGKVYRKVGGYGTQAPSFEHGGDPRKPEAADAGGKAHDGAGQPVYPHV